MKSKRNIQGILLAESQESLHGGGEFRETEERFGSKTRSEKMFSSSIAQIINGIDRDELLPLTTS